MDHRLGDFPFVPVDRIADIDSVDNIVQYSDKVAQHHNEKKPCQSCYIVYVLPQSTDSP